MPPAHSRTRSGSIRSSWWPTGARPWPETTRCGWSRTWPAPDGFWDGWLRPAQNVSRSRPLNANAHICRRSRRCSVAATSSSAIAGIWKRCDRSTSDIRTMWTRRLFTRWRRSVRPMTAATNPSTWRPRRRWSKPSPRTRTIPASRITSFIPTTIPCTRCADCPPPGGTRQSRRPRRMRCTWRRTFISPPACGTMSSPPTNGRRRSPPTVRAPPADRRPDAAIRTCGCSTATFSRAVARPHERFSTAAGLRRPPPAVSQRDRRSRIRSIPTTFLPGPTFRCGAATWSIPRRTTTRSRAKIFRLAALPARSWRARSSVRWLQRRPGTWRVWPRRRTMCSRHAAFLKQRWTTGATRISTAAVPPSSIGRSRRSPLSFAIEHRTR